MMRLCPIKYGGVVAGDPLASYVAVLYHFDNDSAAGTAIENKGYAGAVNTCSVGSIHSASPMTGTKSAGQAQDAGDFAYLNIENTQSSIAYSGTVKFCIETSWIYDMDRPAQQQDFLSIYVGASGAPNATYYYGVHRQATTGYLVVKTNKGGSTVTQASTYAVSDAVTKHQLALTLDGTELVLYAQGNEVARITVTTNTATSIQHGFTRNSSLGGFKAWGKHDECRLTLGHERYTGNYTPETGAFPDP